MRFAIVVVAVILFVAVNARSDSRDSRNRGKRFQMKNARANLKVDNLNENNIGDVDSDDEVSISWNSDRDSEDDDSDRSRWSRDSDDSDDSDRSDRRGRGRGRGRGRRGRRGPFGVPRRGQRQPATQDCTCTGVNTGSATCTVPTADINNFVNQAYSPCLSVCLASLFTNQAKCAPNTLTRGTLSCQCPGLFGVPPRFVLEPTPTGTTDANARGRSCWDQCNRRRGRRN